MGVYLGLPEKICGSKKQAFAFIQERLLSRINSWSGKLLSKGGKEILIKSVAQALPTYVMSCFLLPMEIIRKLTSAISRFWWSTKQNNKGLHWIAWKDICIPQDKGGLGFRDFKNFNLALLAKQLWRLVQYPDSLLARVLKGRYYRLSNPLDVKKASSPSYVWRSLMAAQPLLNAGLRRSVGSGNGTLVWSDRWIPDTTPRPALPRGPSFDPHLRVSDLIDPATFDWNLPKLRDLLAPEDIPLVLSLRLRRSSRPDSFVWAPTKSGAYTVQSGYTLAMAMDSSLATVPVTEPSTTALKAKAWSVKTSRKIKHFIWQALSDCVPVCSRLTDRHCSTERNCPRCGADNETINHLLFKCPPTVQVWALAHIPHSPGSFPSTSIFSNLNHLLW